MRDHEDLFGRPHLSARDQHRVESANEIYTTAVWVLLWCFQLSIAVTIENPFRSWLWAILAALVKRFDNTPFAAWFFNFIDVNFDMCMHGGARPKSTRLKCSADYWTDMALECDRSHTHLPWTLTSDGSRWSFSTAAEAEYPTLFCERCAACLANTLPREQLAFTDKKFRLDSLRMLGQQTKTHHQLVAEFANFVTVNVLPPAGSLVHERHFKLLDPHRAGEKEADVANNDDNIDNISKHNRTDAFRLGLYYNHIEHLGQAMELKHPVESASAVPDDLKVAIVNVLSKGLTVTARERLESLKQYVAMGKSLRSDEEKLSQEQSPSVRAVVAKKRIRVFEQILHDVGFEDMTVVRHMID